jgi:serine-type D-Ala-D-Ala carboxypeptidase (penicillin-binding protein 5/6)
MFTVLPETHPMNASRRHFLRHAALSATSAMVAPRLVLAQSPQFGCRAYAIADHDSGQILESEHADTKLPIASLTKIATAMVVIDWATKFKRNLSSVATVPADAAKLSSLAPSIFSPGDRVALRSLLYAALVQSDNIAAYTLASNLGSGFPNESEGSAPPEYAFVAQMNALARQLGMKSTRFQNAHGLEALEKHSLHSTAADLAKLSIYAMSNSEFRFYVSQPSREISVESSTKGSTTVTLQNTNSLLGINKIDGVKTGSTQRSGGCVIISAARTPETWTVGDEHFSRTRRLHVVVLGSENRFDTARNILSRGWNIFDQWVAQGRPEKNRKTLFNR